MNNLKCFEVSGLSGSIKCTTNGLVSIANEGQTIIVCEETKKTQQGKNIEEKVIDYMV
jgi:hypothetical protein